MRSNRNISFDDMKERISAKIFKRCERRISKFFYKFPVSTNPINFTEIKIVDDENLDTMVSFYCGNRSNQNAPIQLFTELTGVEPTEDLTLLGEEHGAQEPCMVVLISYVDSQLIVRRVDIDLKVAPNTDVVGDDGYDSSDPCDHEVNSDNDLDVDEVSDDINDEGLNDDRNINVSSFKNHI
ncbi:hypothetical protein J1N35_000579 [Gossypium stocksii]|uniref:Transposase MuDR plant domain-containing protein n=1 Tax=Gossypium stocksii TaxID=47602 RepID=A0A9D3WIM3_9ROSI|nr:hypothetical protein J1N35_000579 [Gossypium stocksii]